MQEVFLRDLPRGSLILPMNELLNSITDVIEMIKSV